MISQPERHHADPDGRERVIRTLADADRLVLAGHLPLDGDGLGSALALCGSLRAAGREAVVLLGAEPPRNLRFLPGVDTALRCGDPLPFEPNVFVALDGTSLSRFGDMIPVAESAGLLVNVDHHVTNDRFGDVCWVDDTYAATGLMVYDLVDDLGLTIDRDGATALYTALVTDTGRFSYANTSPEAHECAAALLRLGVCPDGVLAELYRSLPAGRLRLGAEVVERIGTTLDGRVSWSEITTDMYERHGVEPSDTHDLVETPLSLAGVEVALFFRETPDGYHISLRSRGGLNVAMFARDHGGGGHPRAAGFTDDGPLEVLRERIVGEVVEAIRDGTGA